MRRVLCAVPLAVAIAGCSRPPAQTAEASTDLPTVRVAAVERRDLATDITLTAEFEPFEEVDVMAKLTGYIREMRVDVGDCVRRGQVLATLDVPEMQDELTKATAGVQQTDAEFAAAKDEATRIESTHELAHLSYERIRRVADTEPGLVPRQDLDEVRVRDQSAEAQVAASRSTLKAVEQKTHVSRAEQARLETLYRYASIVAPYDGVITRRYANVGTMVQPGGSPQIGGVVRVAEERRLRLILPVPEIAVPSLKLGAPVSVLVPSMNRTFTGQVARFTNRIQQNTRTMDTQVDVGNADGLLVPGMYAEVRLSTERRPGALSVPIDAIDRAERSPRVFTVAADGVVHAQAVTLGLDTAQLVEVRSGLSEGQRVVLGRHAELREGERVRPQAEAR